MPSKSSKSLIYGIYRSPLTAIRGCISDEGAFALKALDCLINVKKSNPDSQILVDIRRSSRVSCISELGLLKHTSTFRSTDPLSSTDHKFENSKSFWCR